MTEAMWSCRKCGAQNEIFRNWCRSCNGTRDEALGASAPSWSAAAPPPPPPERRSGGVRPLVVVAIIVVLALAGAGAFVVLRPDAAKVAAESPDPRTPEQIWADTATANAVKLTQADLPAGWHSEPRPDHSGDSPEEKADKRRAVDSFVSCMGASDAALLSDDVKLSPGTGKSDEFKADMGSASGEADVTVRSSTEVAQADMALLHQPQLADCFAALIDATVRVAIDHPDPGEEIPAGVSFGKATATTIVLPESHAETVAVRMAVLVTGPRGTLTEVFDGVFARKGRTLLSLYLFNVGESFPADIAVQLLNTMADRTPDV